MDINYLLNKKIIIVGYGVSGKAVKEFLDRHNIKSVVTDGSLKEKGIVDPALCFNDKFDLAIVSPSIPPQKFKNAFPGAKITTEVELANSLCKTPAVCVTGTNGKTTVVKLLEHILKIDGKNAIAVGNVGVPYISNCDQDVLPVCELSSFMLDKAEELILQAGIILNVTPDHLIYHKTFKNYLNSKLKLSEFCKRSSLLLNKKVPLIVNANLKKYFYDKNALFFSVHEETEGIYFDGKDRMISLRGKKESFPFFERPGHLAEENILPVLLTCRSLGVKDQSVLDGIATFKAEPFRLQKTACIANIDLYNDSKGTNPDSTLFALKTLNGKKCLIMGGYDKGLDMRSFFKRIKNLGTEAVFLCGANGQALLKDAQSAGYGNAVICDDLSFALEKALCFCKKNGVKTLLFSPATSSFDSFKNYIERGKYFEKLIQKYQS